MRELKYPKIDGDSSGGLKERGFLFQVRSQTGVWERARKRSFVIGVEIATSRRDEISVAKNE
jgi:hypothetical protein